MTLKDASVKVEWHQALNATKWGTMKQPLALTSELAESQSEKTRKKKEKEIWRLSNK